MAGELRTHEWESRCERLLCTCCSCCIVGLGVDELCVGLRSLVSVCHHLLPATQAALEPDDVSKPNDILGVVVRLLVLTALVTLRVQLAGRGFVMRMGVP